MLGGARSNSGENLLSRKINFRMRNRFARFGAAFVALLILPIMASAQAPAPAPGVEAAPGGRFHLAHRTTLTIFRVSGSPAEPGW